MKQRFALTLLVLGWPLSLSAQIQRHPDLRYLRIPAAPSNKASLKDDPHAPPFRLTTSPLASFGSEGDAQDVLLGEILGAMFLSGGGVALLDGKLTNLRLFDAGAHPLQSLGRAGQGPGEFTSRLLSLATDSAEQLFVADLSRSAKIFHRGADGYHYLKAVPLGLSPQAMCLIGPTLFAVGAVTGDPKALHAFRLGGTKVADFGPVYDSPNSAYNYQFIRGYLTCDPSGKAIFFALQAGFGEVRAYRPDGQPLWRTSISGFLSNAVEDTPNGYRIQRSESGVHTVMSQTLLPGYGLLVQVGHRTRADLENEVSYSTLTSFLLDPVSGRPTCLGNTLPLIVAATATRVLVVGDDPVPHFEIHALTAP